MRINELLVESQQLDEGPFTQAIGKVGGKIARGVANVGKDLKTGFKAGYSGEQPAASPAAATTTAPATTTKSGVKQGLAKAFSDPATTAAPAATTTAAPVADPAAEKQSKIGVGQINKIIPTLRTRDLLSLQANLEKAIASKKKEPVAAPAASATTAAPAATSTATAAPADGKVKQTRAKKPTQAEIDADRARLMGPNSESTVKQGRVVAESFSLYRQY